MASLQDIRHRIKSVKNIQQITKAMKMVASARLRKAQSAAIANKPYAEKMYQVIADVTENVKDFKHPLLNKNEEGRTLFVVISADKGLAGAYTSNIIKETKLHIAGTNEAQLSMEEATKTQPPKHTSNASKDKVTMQAAMQQPSEDLHSLHKMQKLIQDTIDRDNLDMITVGKKATEHFQKHGFNVINTYTGFSEKPKYENAREIANQVMSLFSDGAYKDVYIVYTRFVSAMTALPETVRILPFEGVDKQEDKFNDIEYIYEPSAKDVLQILLPQYIITMLYAALLQAAASELSCRMTAMSNATDNAEDLIGRLGLHYNKVRQANITREISEIVGGAEALK